MSPTQRSLKKLRDDGWPLVSVVEYYNYWTKRRHDLFGIIDILAVGPKGTLAVQATGGGNGSARVKKIEESGIVPTLNAAGWEICVHDWRKLVVTRGKPMKRWNCKLIVVGKSKKVMLNRERIRNNML